MDLSDQTTQLLVMMVAAGVGAFATFAILLREQDEAAAAAVESPFAVSTEGERICPRCAMGNSWIDSTCLSCGAPLPR